jgi:hypothetical protein
VLTLVHAARVLTGVLTGATGKGGCHGGVQPQPDTQKRREMMRTTFADRGIPLSGEEL